MFVINFWKFPECMPAESNKRCFAKTLDWELCDWGRWDRWFPWINYLVLNDLDEHVILLNERFFESFRGFLYCDVFIFGTKVIIISTHALSVSIVNESLKCNCVLSFSASWHSHPATIISSLNETQLYGFQLLVLI